MRRRSATIAAILISASLWTSTAEAKPRPGRNVLPEQQEATVREAYSRLAAIVAAGGGAIEFSLADLETIAADRFEHFFWLDVVTMPGGYMVDMARESRRDESGVQRVVYRPSWNLPLDGAAESLSSSAQGMTIADVLAVVAEENPRVSSATALTTYEVVVTYQGHARSYRAAALWLAPPKPGRDATVMFLDNVTQGVEEALRERPAAPVRPAAVPTPEKIDNGSCFPGSAEMQYRKTVYGQEDHGGDYPGAHWAQLDADILCTCASTCRANCTTTILDTTDCTDFGTVSPGNDFACHKMGTSRDIRDTPSFDGRSEPASCNFALGCVAKRCAFCACNLGVSISWAGLAVNFNTSGGDPDWVLNISPGNGIVCPPCQEDEAAPHYPPTTSPTSGPGGCGWVQPTCSYSQWGSLGFWDCAAWYSC